MRENQRLERVDLAAMEQVVRQLSVVHNPSLLSLETPGSLAVGWHLEVRDNRSLPTSSLTGLAERGPAATVVCGNRDGEACP